MKRHLIPGGYDHHGVARASTCCTGECNQGRSCPLTVDRICHAVVPQQPIRQRPVIGAQLIPGGVVRIQPAVQRCKPSRWKRTCRSAREFWAFLLSPRWMP